MYDLCFVCALFLFKVPICVNKIFISVGKIDITSTLLAYNILLQNDDIFLSSLYDDDHDAVED